MPKRKAISQTVIDTDALLTLVETWKPVCYAKHAKHPTPLVDEFLKFIMLKAMNHDE